MLATILTTVIESKRAVEKQQGYLYTGEHHASGRFSTRTSWVLTHQPEQDSTFTLRLDLY